MDDVGNGAKQDQWDDRSAGNQTGGMTKRRETRPMEWQTNGMADQWNGRPMEWQTNGTTD